MNQIIKKFIKNFGPNIAIVAVIFLLFNVIPILIGDIITHSPLSLNMNATQIFIRLLMYYLISLILLKFVVQYKTVYKKVTANQRRK